MAAAYMKRLVLSKRFQAGLLGFLLGVVLILVIRFVTYQIPQRPHYHANFDVYINGQREQFKDDFYYESIMACATETTLTPKERVHMHSHISDVVHVHDNAITWGHFFQSIGWNIIAGYLSTPTQLLPADGGHKVSMILNGQPVDGINLLVIGDRDRLLVDYGNTSSTQLENEFQAVPSSATKYDTGQDPATCSGSQKTTATDRLKHLL
jgi:hypothetical protein